LCYCASRKTAAILATAAARFGLQACRDVESEKIDHVNDLIRQFCGLQVPGICTSRQVAGSIS
jgi:hypothetical protein